ncbi:hypothetical protein BpHYR1_042653 [Brachionus plicatilis]|uniref:Uncharacterized protein n=1 Tax=Brachionus plicatilis TaxID=10195 RepID=A0A3M7Q9R2_BRAPC|nr:hypothetical protein BpHYR1_042653 [Brachionus plicatilis]
MAHFIHVFKKHIPRHNSNNFLDVFVGKLARCLLSNDLNFFTTDLQFCLKEKIIACSKDLLKIISKNRVFNFSKIIFFKQKQINAGAELHYLFNFLIKI